MKTAVLTFVLLAALAAPARAGTFCPDYGVECYRAYGPDRETGVMVTLRDLWATKGDYIGAVGLDAGQCGFLTCAPCDESLAQVDWDCLCNKRYPACEGRCFHQ